MDVKADVNCRGPEGRTALYYALVNGNTLCIRHLLLNGADPNMPVGTNTPLNLAVLDGG